MRITFWNSFPAIFLCTYVLAAPILQLSLFSSILLLIAYFVVDRFRVLGGFGRNPYDKELVLETISASHYVEKVRWCLDYLDIPYHEVENVGILGIFLLGRWVPRLTVPAKGICISNSSDILRYLLGRYYTQKDKVEFLQVSEASLEWEEKFDLVGKYSRVVVYNTLFGNKDATPLLTKVWGLNQSKIPKWQKLVLTYFYPVLLKIVERRLCITQEHTVESFKKLNAIFSEVEDVLKSGNKYILGTEEPTYLDFHFASMAALVLAPENYSGRLLEDDARKAIVELTGLLPAEITQLRSRPAGQFALRLYEEFRLCKRAK